MKKTKIFLALCFAIALVSCGTNEYKIKYGEFAEKMKGENTVLLDVRTPGEFEGGYIEGAINLDINSGNFEEELGKLDKEKTYLVYCLRGTRSGNAVAKMKELGFKEMYDLEGGITTWKVHNQPIVSNAKPATETTGIVPYATALQSEKLVMVDFTAVWCPPCQRMKPSIHKLRDEMKDSVLITEVDVDDEKSIAQQNDISSMPTLVFYKGGKEVSRTVGYRSEAELKATIEEVLISVK